MAGFVLETAATGQQRADAAADKVRQEVLNAKGQPSGFALLDTNSGLLVPKYLVRTAQSAPSNPTGSNQWIDYIDLADAQHKTRSTAGVVKRATWDWGTGTAFPTGGMVRGDSFVHSALGAYVYNGSSWRQSETPALTQAQRIALSSYYSQMHHGWRCFETDGRRHFYFDALSSRLVKYAGWRDLIYDQGNQGNSGLVGAGSNAFITSVNISSDLWSDMAYIDYVANVASNSGSNVGSVDVFWGGVVISAKIFNVGTTGQTVSFSLPVQIGPGATQFAMRITNSQGAGAVFLNTSSLRVVI